MKLMDELKDGARIVTYIWTFDDWEPEKADRKTSLVFTGFQKVIN